MQKLIKNNWQLTPGGAFSRARILDPALDPEGLDVERLRFLQAGTLVPASHDGHIVSVIRGRGKLLVANGTAQQFDLRTGVHVYLPAGRESALEAEQGTELLKVSGASAGQQLLLRDETFLAACASGTQSLRWILTPQYLSRRIFLHHDQTLVSRSGNPVSWFRTTLFDMAGPASKDGDAVFKMSCSSRSTLTVCYEAQGNAHVRRALNSNAEPDQPWGRWIPLDGDTTCHLNGTAGPREEERPANRIAGTGQPLRNKHEVQVRNGPVSLFCLFDPALTGIERNRPGEYTDYEPLSRVIGTELYEQHRRELAKYDQMLDQLSMARAMRSLHLLGRTPVWELYLQGRRSQAEIEAAIAKSLISEGKGRERILAPWMQTADGNGETSRGKERAFPADRNRESISWC